MLQILHEETNIIRTQNVTKILKLTDITPNEIIKITAPSISSYKHKGSRFQRFHTLQR